MTYNRRRFLETASAGVALLPARRSTLAKPVRASAGDTIVQERPHSSAEKMIRNVPSMVEADGALRFDFSDEIMVLDGGLQPFMLCTKAGTLIVQAQSPHSPFESPRMHYAYALWTTVSRDN